MTIFVNLAHNGALSWLQAEAMLVVVSTGTLLWCSQSRPCGGPSLVGPRLTVKPIKQGYPLKSLGCAWRSWVRICRTRDLGRYLGPDAIHIVTSAYKPLNLQPSTLYWSLSNG